MKIHTLIMHTVNSHNTRGRKRTLKVFREKRNACTGSRMRMAPHFSKDMWNAGR